MGNWRWKYSTVEGVDVISGMVNREEGWELDVDQVEEIVNIFTLSGGAIDSMLKRAVEGDEAKIDPAKFRQGVLRSYVTVIPMKRRVLHLQGLTGQTVCLTAREPAFEDLDEAILFGDRPNVPLGITRSMACVMVNRLGTDVYFDDLANMMDHLIPTISARWLVNRGFIPHLAHLRNSSGLPLLHNGYNLLGFPTTWLDGDMCERHGFDMMLADLRYYALGEYQGEDGLMLDGAPMLGGPFWPEDRSRGISPFVVLRRPD